jgi:Cft2 family RNA processing exonuclease
MPYRAPLDWGGLRLTTYPAGHCLGSAMLLAEDGCQTLLYSGDFKLGTSHTSEEAELPPADILVVESTYGDPRYRLPPRETVIAEFIDLVRRLLARECVPVVQAYTLGKAQEVTAILTRAGLPVLQHADVYAVSQVYERCGMSLGHYLRYPGYPLPGHVIVVPPHVNRWRPLHGVQRQVTIAVTGWAAVANTRRWSQADYALPLSDHADYDQLFEAIAIVDPKVVYCTHGPASFVEHLRRAGINAHPLDGQPVALGAAGA